jgi:hypothetical protein
MNTDVIVCQFSRLKVERGDFRHFLNLYAPDKWPTGRRLREMMDCMMFCIEGYDRDERELHSIPEVRKFYRAFHAAWPYWLYFTNLDQDCLKMMVFCCIDSFTAIKVDGQPNCLVQYDPLELLHFLQADLPHMSSACQRAGMLNHLAQERTKRLFELFDLLNAG